MLLNIKNNIKHKFPRLYDLTRGILFPLYARQRSKKLSKFKSQVKDIEFGGIKYKLVLDAKNGFVDEEIYWKGVYEEEVMTVLQEVIVEASVGGSAGAAHRSHVLFMDIGTNIGQELIFAGAIARDILQNTGCCNTDIDISFQAVGFEPIHRLYDQVNQSIEANELQSIVKVMNYALGDIDAEMQLRTPIINVGGSSLVRNENNTVGDMIEETILVRNGDEAFKSVFEFDTLALDAKVVKLIIKIDVEGYEYEVIKGLANTIRQYSPTIILEYSPAFYIKDSAINDRSMMGVRLLELLVKDNYKMEIIDIGIYKGKIYKGKIYKGEEILKWGEEFRGDQANLLLYKAN